MKQKALLLMTFFSFFLYAEDKKIALMFLTRSDLNHTELWKEWIDVEKFNIYVHAKTQPKNEWFSKFCISNIQPTEWGFLLYGYQALLQESLKDPSNYKFVLVSESCVPLWPSDYVYNYLTSCEESHMQILKPWWGENPKRVLREFPEEHRLGNHQWIILNRKHAQMIADDNYWIHLAMKYLACDEAYPSTFFSMHKLLHEFRDELTTFVDWSRGCPRLFTRNSSVNNKILLEAKYSLNNKKKPCRMLFARKFAKQYPDNAIKELILMKESK